MCHLIYWIVRLSVESLYVEANEPPLRERRMGLLMKYGLRIKCNVNNPAYNSLFNLRFQHLYNSPVYNNRRGVARPRRRARSLAVDLHELLEEAQIDSSKVKTNIIPFIPPCYFQDIEVCF